MVCFESVFDVVNVFLLGKHSADRAFLLIWNRVLNLIAKLVCLYMSRHIPISVDTEEVESVETIVNSNQVFSISELPVFKFLLSLTKWFQTNRAATSKRVIVCRQNFSQFLVDAIQKTIDFLCLLIAKIG